MGKRRPPAVNEYMTRLPYELDRRDVVAQARITMTGSGIRHLPIMDGSRLFGVVSQRDLLPATVEALAPLGEICKRDVVTIAPTDSVVHAARTMMRRKVGSAIVVDAGMVVGIFTTTDALSALVGAYTPAKNQEAHP